MEIPEIQYQPQQVSPSFNPVQAIDTTSLMRQNHAITRQGMQAQLGQMRQNASIEQQNIKDQSILEELSSFSSTLQNFMMEKAERQKEEDLNEGAMLAFTEGLGVDESFNQQESQLKKDGEAIDRRAGAYERETGDVEGAERIRGLSGWKKYGYMKAKAEQAGAGFGAFMSGNATNSQFSVNGFTLANAPDSPTRQAIAAKMASTYMKPYQGLNKSFMGKYLFPGMQRGMASTVATYTAENNKRLLANRFDTVKQQFLMSEDKTSAMQTMRSELTAMGYTEAQIRSEMVGMAGQFQSRSQLDSFLDAPYGPNGKSFREQYPKEAQEAVDGFNSLKTSQATNAAAERNIADLEAKEEAMTAVLKDREDGNFDANPARLQELAELARNSGLEKTAKFWESQISETAFMKNSDVVKKQYEAQIMAGVIPSNEEILQNPALSQKDKQSLLQNSGSSGGKSPDSATAKGHKRIIEASIRKRGKWTRDGANDPGVAAMELLAWQEYTEVYNRELQSNGGNEAAAANAALSDFKSKFGTDEKTGQYGLVQPDADGKVQPGRVGKYAGYDPEGVLSDSREALEQFNEKLKYSDANTIINTFPDLYEGEEKQLKTLSDSFATTGSVGTIPPLYYQLQQRYGGDVSIMDLVNKRLEANNMDKLPDELNEIIKPVEDTFDKDTYKYINYKPNATRTDIGLISSGVDPIYRTSPPNSVASDPEFQSAVSATAGRLGVSEADLYAVMSFETGGTFDPGIRNAAGSGATGLIQFMPSTARGLGTSTQALANMGRVQQMQYVERYLKNAGVRPGANLSDLYMAVLFPAAVGKSDNFVLFGRGAMSGYTGVAYTQNSGLDSNGDGSVTKAEAAAKVLRHREPASSASTWRQPKNVRPELQ